jgi:hypothetical protein
MNKGRPLLQTQAARWRAAIYHPQHVQPYVTVHQYDSSDSADNAHTIPQITGTLF